MKLIDRGSWPRVVHKRVQGGTLAGAICVSRTRCDTQVVRRRCGTHFPIKWTPDLRRTANALPRVRGTLRSIEPFANGLTVEIGRAHV